MNDQKKDRNCTPADRAVWPVTCAARDGLCEISERYIDEYEAALKSTPKENRLEKRALSIQLNMAKLTRTFVCFNYNRVAMKQQSLAQEKMLRRFGLVVPDFPDFAALTEDGQSAWLQFAGSTAFLHQAFIDQHLEKLNAGLASGNANQVFESRIVLGTLYTILREWLTWWRENGTFPFERWTYTEEPWADGSGEE